MSNSSTEKDKLIIKRGYEIIEVAEIAEAKDDWNSHEKICDTKWVKLNSLKAWLQNKSDKYSGSPERIRFYKEFTEELSEEIASL